MALQLQVSARDPGCWCGDMDMVACTALSSRALRLTSVTGWQLGRPGAGPGWGWAGGEASSGMARGPAATFPAAGVAAGLWAGPTYERAVLCLCVVVYWIGGGDNVS